MKTNKSPWHAGILDLAKVKTRKTSLIAAMLIASSAGTAHAATIDFVGSNLTFIDSSGVTMGGTNDVAGSWDGTFDTAASGTGSTNFNMSLGSASSYPFYGYTWTAHNIRVFGPGTYTFNVDCTTAQLNAGTCTPNVNPARNITMTVGAGQIGAHILWDWNSFYNVDIVNVWSQNAVFGPSSMYIGPAGLNSPYMGTNSPDKVWDLMSTDANASCPGAVDNNGTPINCGPDGINGIPMIDGPFLGFSANFNLSSVPVPATFWLFGSGLLGFFGLMWRRRT